MHKISVLGDYYYDKYLLVSRPFARALTGPIFGPIPNAKLRVFFPIEKINSQLRN